jgi:hypothetical protein
VLCQLVKITLNDQVRWAAARRARGTVRLMRDPRLDRYWSRGDVAVTVTTKPAQGNTERGRLRVLAQDDVALPLKDRICRRFTIAERLKETRS